MAKRSLIDVPTGYSVEQVNTLLTQFAQAEGFRVVNYKGEQAFKKGYGILVSPMFIKTMIAPGTVHIEAWIRAFGEKDLEGFVGAIPKAMLKEKVDKLVRALAPPQ